MIRRKFIIAAVIAVAAPALIVSLWSFLAWGAANDISLRGIAYIALPSLVGVVVGGSIYSGIRKSCSGGILSFFAAGLLTGVMVPIVLPHRGPGDGYPATLFLLIFCMGLSGVVGFIFGTGLGQSWPGRHQQ